MARGDSSWRRDAAYFVAGPAVLTVACAAAFHLRPWAVPVASPTTIFAPAPLLVILAAGVVGAALSSRAGYPSVPAIGDLKGWARLLPPTIGSGVLFGAALLGVDAVTHFTAGALASLGATWINVPLPQSLAHYGAAAVLLECVYRILPLPLIGWVVGRLFPRARGSGALFWTLAVLTSCLEPASLLALARPGAMAALATLVAIAFGANIVEAAEMRRYGWPAPVLFRLAFYAVWHCFGPYLLPPSSVLYPGPH
jgi:hypothetical protein